MNRCCLFGWDYQNLDSALNRKWSSFYSYITGEYEHMGMIQSIKPLCNSVGDIPERYLGYCYHQIKMADGSSFKLINNKITIDILNRKFREDMIIKIVYKKPGNIIIKMCPMIRHSRRDTTLETLLYEDETLINNNVTAHYENNQIRRIDIKDTDMVVVQL